MKQIMRLAAIESEGVLFQVGLKVLSGSSLPFMKDSSDFCVASSSHYKYQ
jgi:hypothetical protein